MIEDTVLGFIVYTLTKKEDISWGGGQISSHHVLRFKFDTKFYLRYALIIFGNEILQINQHL